jgi:hypothetical protein
MARFSSGDALRRGKSKSGSRMQVFNDGGAAGYGRIHDPSPQATHLRFPHRGQNSSGFGNPQR